MSEDCTCLIDGSQDDPLPELFQETIRRARREWKCIECGDPIAPGETYEEARGKWEGTWDTHRTCQGCANIRSVLCCGSWTYGELLNELREAGIVEAQKALQACLLRELSEAGAMQLKKLWMEAVEHETAGIPRLPQKEAGGQEHA